MDYKELLLSISNIIDKKIDPIYVKLDALDARMTSIEKRMDSLEAKVDSLKKRMDSLEAKVDSLEAKVDSLEAKVDSLKDEIDIVDQKHTSNYRTIKNILEGDILPRLKEIEACYVSTSKRYMIEVERIDSLYLDMQVVKSIVQDHHQKLQKLELVS